MAKSRLYRWTRDLHLYVGLFLSPFVVVFALSVFFLTHTWLPWSGSGQASVDTVRITLPEPLPTENLALARLVQRQIHVPGEINFIGRDLEQNFVSFPITVPGRRTNVRVDLSAATARTATRTTGPWDAMVYLHKMPGPHNVAVRGNWVFTNIWGWLADTTVYLLLFLTVSGLYLWLTLRSERRAGWLLLGAGAVSFSALVLSVVA